MSRRKKIADAVVFVFLAFGSVIMLYPFIWMIFTSFKPKMHIYLAGLLPRTWDFSSYIQIWDEIPLVRGFLNTILYSVPPVIVGTFVSAGAAFAFAKINFKGKNIIFLILLSGVMIPFPSIMIPQFVLFSRFNMLQGPWPMILPKLTGNVLMIFFLRQYLNYVPDSVVEAAKIDGCNYFEIYRRIILPLITPALAAHSVLWFIGSWNDYLAPTIFIKNEKWQPVTVMVAKFNEQYAINTHVPRMMAGSVMLLVPVLVIYGIFQKWIIESVMFTSVKE
ncbi:ABC-type sugar transport system, permease component [Thermoclostridium stercorarium subsp. stercorarium DSM 8532]|jgi:multiple sugar transport system permease protein|uniref:ABC-type sugar transport system, permease component n=3 Tax=Thermoclostridium stercorarium TaxID=1510 RepID=L7VPM4_THES1|nr:carbohydrate ABC transporter permease [Thermoclostridium stercorarium]AGC67528.1 ABC-type sugar transport system, permease component [Thermoclostridium stercorarium subsp. stercorarium DSM 8532]AGI38580.1 ABC transporter permease subunit [Thermoclostridium stercorarium subsp. stercorarium DSM 8532]ANW97953.1 sugar ABC transporter permease [Thermoclostridium stercorarium subsp. thermolacticum DSM 2910]ANX00503.1 sugar ABC transporter permease [Thermoclostridium stercorarium subsp. leptospartu